jgi:hypothetical protein
MSRSFGLNPKLELDSKIENKEKYYKIQNIGIFKLSIEPENKPAIKSGNLNWN